MMIDSLPSSLVLARLHAGVKYGPRHHVRLLRAEILTTAVGLDKEDYAI